MGYTFHFEIIFRNLDFLLQGLKLTAYISVLSTLFSIGIGTVAAVARLSGHKVLDKIFGVYIEIFRNTPLLIQLWFIYFGLGELGFNLSPLPAGIFALSINAGAYTAEIIRGGIISVEYELKESAASLGMRPLQAYRYVVLPLAFRIILPPLANQIVQNILASSLLMVLSVNELTNQATRLSSRTFRTFEVYAVVAGLYLILTSLVSAASKRLEKYWQARGATS